jgi:hypothetical protein
MLERSSNKESSFWNMPETLSVGKKGLLVRKCILLTKEVTFTSLPGTVNDIGKYKCYFWPPRVCYSLTILNAVHLHILGGSSTRALDSLKLGPIFGPVPNANLFNSYLDPPKKVSISQFP